MPRMGRVPNENRGRNSKIDSSLHILCTKGLCQRVTLYSIFLSIICNNSYDGC